MPDISVGTAVEKMLGGRPAAPAATDAPPAEAPAGKTLAKEPAASAASEQGGGEDRTAFEQELIEGLDTEERQEFDAATAAEQTRQVAWMKRQYRKAAKQMTELGSHRKVMGALRDAGVTGEDLIELTKRKRNGSAAPAKPETAAEGKRGFDRWREKAKDSAEREDLDEAEQVIADKIEDMVRKMLAEEVGPIRQRLESADRDSLRAREHSLEKELNGLEDELGYPGSLIETHREAMTRLGLQEPRLSAEDLLVRVAGFATVKAAMLKAAKIDEKPPIDRKPLGSPVIKKPVQEPPARNSRGRASISKFVEGLLAPKPT